MAAALSACTLKAYVFDAAEPDAQTDEGITDAVIDAQDTPCGDTTTDPSNCGACGHMCAVPTNGTATCAASVCGVSCGLGQVPSSGGGTLACVSAARPVWPPNGSWVRTQRPNFEAGGIPSDGTVTIEPCADRTCATPGAALCTVPSGASRCQSLSTLTGTVFWRVNTRTLAGTASSTVFEAHVETRSAVTSANVAVDSVLDFDADGQTDLAVGRPQPAGSPGAIDLYLPGNATTPCTLTTAGNTRLGSVVFSAGDVNGDGFVDLGAVAQTPSSNVVLIWSGSATGCSSSASPAWTLSDASSLRFAETASGAGDFNRDGFADIVVGDGSSNTAFIYFGSATGPGAGQPIAIPDPTSMQSRVAPAGDFDGDGFNDVIVADPLRAEVFLFRGGAGAVMAGVRVWPSSTNDFGVSTAFGDLNGDGFDDLLVGDETGSGRVYLFHGDATANVNAAIAAPASTITPPTGSPLAFGARMGSIGDVNHDGFDDAAVFASSGVTAVSLVLGAAGSNAVASVLNNLTSGQPSVVAGGGDVSGDGIPDLVVGDPLASGNSGLVAVYSSTGTSVLGILLTTHGGATGDLAGFSTATGIQPGVSH